MNKFILALLLGLPLKIYAQSANLTINRDYYHLLERYEIMTGKFSENFHSHVKPYQRVHVGAYIDSLYHNKAFYGSLGDRDRFNLEYLANDNWEWTQTDSSDSRKPFLKYFYRKKSDFLHVDEGDFDLHVNPVIYFSGGKESASDVTTYINGVTSTAWCREKDFGSSSRPTAWTTLRQRATSLLSL